MSSVRPGIVVAERYSPAAMDVLHAHGEVTVLPSVDADTLIKAVGSADALLIRSYAKVTREVIEAGKNLKVIGRGGVGIENIDLQAAHERNITVVYTPQASTRSVAEHALGLMLAVERQLTVCNQAARDGSFKQYRSKAQYRELGDCVVGIVGMGRIGSTFARMCSQGLGMRVLYKDIVDVGPFDFPAERTDKDQLFSEADIVSLHVPLTSETRGMIDSQVLSMFKPTSILLNTSRGAVVEEAALVEALKKGTLAGAGLDVFNTEPLAVNDPLLDAPNMVLTPHVAGRSECARKRMNDVVNDVIAVLEGRPPRFMA